MGVKLPTMTSQRAHKSGSFMHWVRPFDCVVSSHDSVQVYLLAVYQIAYVRVFFFFRRTSFRSCPVMTISLRIMSFLPGWRKRKTCFSLIFHQNLHVSCSRTLSRFGMLKSLNPVTMRALQVGHGQPITGKSNDSKKVSNWLIL